MIFAPFGRRQRLLLHAPRGLRAPGPCGYFLCEQKYPKSHLNLRFKNPFLGFACPANPRRGPKGCAAGFLDRRSLRIDSSSSAALVLVELRLPPFQRETAVHGAHGLTVHSSDSYPPCQTLVPSAARQPVPSIELCAEVQTGIGPLHGR